MSKMIYNDIFIIPKETMSKPNVYILVFLDVDNCIGTLCQPPETALSTKIVYALWVWCIFLTFPGTFAMQPAVTTQTFGHK